MFTGIPLVHREDLMRLLFFLLVLCVCAGCTTHDSSDVPEDWQTIKAGDAFTFKAPRDVQPEPVQGIDSFVGKYTNTEMILTFDYGRYSDSDPMDRESNERSATMIDGKKAYIARERYGIPSKGKGGKAIGVHFPSVDGDTKLTMYAKLRGADPKTVEKIFRSIDFLE